MAADPHRAVVQSEGYAYRVRAHPLIQHFDRIGGRRSGALHHLLLRSLKILETERKRSEDF